MKLPTEVSGPPDAPAVVFLHGFMGSVADWRDVVEEIGRTHRCVCIDLPGHGGSTRIEAEDGYSFAAAGEGVRAAVEALDLETPVLVGYSMGGRVAVALAVEHPGMWRGLVVESASPGVTGEEARAERRRVDDERAARLDRGSFDRFLKAWYAHPLFGSLANDPALRERLVADRLNNDPAELARALRGMSSGRQPCYLEPLHLVQIPALFLAGALDEGYAAQARTMAGLCPRGHALIVADAGHNVHRERPRAFIEALRGFLEQID